MGRIEKTVFISYRRTNVPWVLAIYQDLTQQGYDVFFDYKGIASGDFESVILENIRARAHFLVLLTPSALKRCGTPDDWLSREIETALETKRNIVPIMLEGFDFGTPEIASSLTGKLAALKAYNALSVPSEYFMEAMDRLRDKFLNVALDAVLHPASDDAKRAAADQQALAAAAPAVIKKELNAQEWFERAQRMGYNYDEQIRCYTEAIRLNPDFAEAYIDRGIVLKWQGKQAEAIKDFNEAIRLKPDDADAYIDRGITQELQGKLAKAIKDFNEAIRLNPGYAEGYFRRGVAHSKQGKLAKAIKDYNKAIRLNPDHINAYYYRGITLKEQGKLAEAIKDFNEAIRINPGFPDFYSDRGVARALQGKLAEAIKDFQKYLDLGGGIRHGNQSDIEKMIHDLVNLSRRQKK